MLMLFVYVHQGGEVELPVLVVGPLLPCMRRVLLALCMRHVLLSLCVSHVLPALCVCHVLLALCVSHALPACLPVGTFVCLWSMCTTTTQSSRLSFQTLTSHCPKRSKCSCKTLTSGRTSRL